MSAARKDKTPGDQARVDELVRAAHESLNYLANNAQLNTIQLCGSSLRVHPAFFIQTQKGASITLNFTLQMIKVEYDPASGAASALLNWRLFANYVESVTPSEGDVPGVPPLDIQTLYLVQYTNLGQHAQNTVVGFVDQLAEFASYPYFRTHVSQLTWSAGLQLPVLPVISAQRRAPRVSGSSIAAPDGGPKQET